MHKLLCCVHAVGDPASLGKEIGQESKKANALLKEAEDKATQIKDMGGIAVPIPAQFYMSVKVVKQ